jgi:hypothetical protein
MMPRGKVYAESRFYFFAVRGHKTRYCTVGARSLRLFLHAGFDRAGSAGAYEKLVIDRKLFFAKAREKARQSL